MSIFGRYPRVDDWIRLEDNPRAGLRTGMAGVVVSTSGGWVTADFDTGWGGRRRASVRGSSCYVIRRGGGAESFHRHNHYIGLARLGVGLVLAWPFIAFAVDYVRRNHTTQGLGGEFAIGFADSFVQWFERFLSSPVRTVVFIVVLGLLTRFAFPHHGRR